MATRLGSIRDGLDWRPYVAEAIGTFALVAVGPGAVMIAASTHTFGHTGVALAFGLVIAFVVAATGHLSGAHINPAVTIAFWSVRRFPGRDVLPYVVAQCTGATAAALALRWVLGPVGQLGATAPALSLGRSFAVELGYSAILAFVIMGVATDERAPAGVAPFAVGATVFGGRSSPARSLVARSTRHGASVLRWPVGDGPRTGSTGSRQSRAWLRRCTSTSDCGLPTPRRSLTACRWVSKDRLHVRR